MQSKPCDKVGIFFDVTYCPGCTGTILLDQQNRALEAATVTLRYSTWCSGAESNVRSLMTNHIIRSSAMFKNLDFVPSINAKDFTKYVNNKI